MCRLYLQYNINPITKQSKSKIIQFLETGTPKNPDGFGFAWINKNTKNWCIYKKPVIYTEDKYLQTKIDRITNSNIVISHIRSNLHPDFLKNNLYNTHPFLYENQIFCHNGSTRKDEDFSATNTIKERIDSKYIPFIQGSTTSELFFYLFLTIKDKIIASKKYKLYEDVLCETVQEIFYCLQNDKLKVLANLIFADEHYIVVTKYKTCNLITEPIKSLFYEKTEEGLCVTSFPIFPNMREFPDNTIMIINIKTGEIQETPIVCFMMYPTNIIL
jgi:predicted glutamine amidotransferase